MVSYSSNTLNRFFRKDDGALIIFGLMLFVLMLMMGGLAIDLMRYENTRVKLQNALDRSTLAAAALSQKMDREGVVRDYMAKAGLSDQLKSVTITEAMNTTEVTATGLADTNPMFLHMLGIEKFDAAGASGAAQAITNLEIVLVLDVSGSMSGTKIANLKVAAKAFVDTIMDNDPNKRASITIVPYNAQVNMGADLVPYFNVTHHNGVANTNCVEIPSAAFDTLALSRTDALPMMAYADIANNTSRITTFVSPTNSAALPNYGSAFCKPTTVNQVRLPNNDRDQLKAQIDGLVAGGNTSITIGMKWGATLIDPSMQSAYTGLISDKKIPAEMAGRPFAYDDPDTMKIIVLMTDGEHVSHARVTDGFKTGTTDGAEIYKGSDGNYSVRYASGRPAEAGTNQYWVPHLCVSTACQSGSNKSEAWKEFPWTVTGVAEKQEWQTVWTNLKATYVAWQFRARALGTDNTSRNRIYNETLAAMRNTWASVADMDSSLDKTCDLVKAKNVIVYGVTVEAPLAGQQVISSCATSVDAHYFEADANTVKKAFETIASNITMLRLTQ